MTKLDMIKQNITTLKAKAEELMKKEGVTVEELTDIQNKIKVEKQKLGLEEVIGVDPQNRAGKVLDNGVLENDKKTEAQKYTTAFYNALKGHVTRDELDILEARNALSSITGADGGYLIPNDQMTEINELKRTLVTLRDYVRVEPVSTRVGSRIIEKNADYVPFVELVEGQEVADTDTPQFTEIKYEIKDYAGILPIPNNLINDSVSNIRSYLNRWLAKKSTATENTLIIKLLDTMATKKTISGIDDIKTVLNVDLDPAISSVAKIYMNQSTFDYYDKLKDSDGNYLLEKDPKNETGKMIAKRPVVVLPDKTLKVINTSGTKKAKVYIGDLKEAVTLFDREAISILGTNIGGAAFVNNRTDVRAITRLDVKKFDTEAVICGEVTLEVPQGA